MYMQDFDKAIYLVAVIIAVLFALIGFMIGVML
jgi:hypothetical protein